MGITNKKKKVTRRKKIISQKEIKIIKDAINKYSGIIYYQLKNRGNKLTILTGTFSEEECALKEAGEKSFEDIYHNSSNYLPMMRFILVDAEERVFEVERYCFRGSIDDWVFIGGSDNLKELAEKYCKHLGRMSFYEL